MPAGARERFNTPMIRPATVTLTLAALTSLAACSATAKGGAPDTTFGSTLAFPPATIGIDGLPEPLTLGTLPELPPAPTDPDASVPPTTVATGPGAPPIQPGTVAEYVDGNRVLVIGDSILASTAPRYQGLLCSVLNDDFGWSVEVHAETGQHIEYATTVLDDRLDSRGLDGFDAVVVMLGNNYRGDYDDFTQRLEALIERLSPRPIVLFTLTERHADHPRINEYIGWRTYFHPNVIVVDWAQFSAAEPDKLLAGDGLHLSDTGRGRIVMFAAAALGPAPATVGRPTCVEHVS